MIVSTLGHLALYGRFYADCRYSKVTSAHSPFDFSLRLYVDLLEGAASLQIEYVLVHRYPYRAWFWGRRTLAQRGFLIDSGLLAQATCRITPPKSCLTLAFL